jgi:hypothetical protein
MPRRTELQTSRPYLAAAGSFSGSTVVPYPDCAVSVGADNGLAVRAERDAEHRAHVTDETYGK